MKTFLSVIVILIFICINVFAQKINSRYEFPDNETIYKINISDNYAAVITNCNYHKQNYADRSQKVYLFDKNGELVRTINYAGEDLVNVFLSEITNSMVVVKAYVCEGDRALVLGYNIDSGSEMWRACIHGYSLDLSPDGKYLLTRSPSFEGSPLFEIIDLQNGGKLPLTNIFKNFQAAWLDNQTVVIVQPQRKINYKYTEWLTMIQPQIDSIDNKLRKLKGKMTQGKITRKEYRENINVLTREKFNIKYPRIKTYRGFLNRAPSKYVMGAAKLIIYNVKDDIIELQKELYTKNGKEFTMSPEGEDINVVNIDKQQNILIYGYEIDETNKEKRCFIKTNRQGEVVWQDIINYKLYTMAKIIINGNIILFIKDAKTDNYYAIDLVNERRVSIEELPLKKEIISELKNLGHDKNLNYFESISINKLQNKIEFNRVLKNEKDFINN